MSECLHNHLPKDLVILCQSFLLPSIFNTYGAKIEVCEEIKNNILDYKKDNEMYEFYMNYYRGDVGISVLLLNPLQVERT